MKKYLMNGALALALGGFVVSCSDENVDFVSLANQKAQAFEKIFEDFAGEYGGIDPTNKWGFTDDMTIADTTGIEPVISVEEQVESELAKTRDAQRAGTRATEGEWTGSYAHSADDYLNPNINLINESLKLNSQTAWMAGQVSVASGTLSVETMRGYTAITDDDLRVHATLSNGDNFPKGDFHHYYIPSGTEITEVFHINATWGIYNDAVIYIEGKVHLNGNTLNGPTLVVGSGGEIVIDGKTDMSNAGRIVVLGGGKITGKSGAEFNVNNGSPCYNAGTIDYSGTFNVNGSDFYNCGTINVDLLRNTAGGKFTNFGSITCRTNTGAGDAYNSTMINGCNWKFKENAGIGSLINLNNSRIDVGGRAEFNSGNQYLYNYSVINAGSMLVNSTKFYGTDNTSDVAIIKTGKIYFADVMLINQDVNNYYQNERYTYVYGKLSGKSKIYLDWDYTETYNKEGVKITDDNGYTMLSVVVGSQWDYVTNANTPFNIDDVNCGGGAKPHVPVVKQVDSPEYTTEDIDDEWYEVTGQEGRIFCEDLGSATREDLDYNDVVFDVHIWHHHYKKITHYWKDIITLTDGSETSREKYVKTQEDTKEETDDDYAEVILKAAGGTLPLTVLGQEVHAAFGVGVTTMVNTRDGNSTAFGSYTTADDVAIGEETIPFTDTNNNTYVKKLTKGYSSAISIPIVVNYDNHEVNELAAGEGKAPHKLFVPINTPWAVERKPLNLGYPNFGNYVNDSKKDWVNTRDAYYLYSGNTYSQETPKVFKSVRLINATDRTLWSGPRSFTDNWNLDELVVSLNVEKFWAGDILRFHAKSVGEQAWLNVQISGLGTYIDTQVINYDPGTGEPSTSSCVEMLITEAMADQLNSLISGGQLQLTLNGRNFTLDRVACLGFDQK